MLKFTFRKIDGKSAYCTKRNTEIELESVEFLWKSFSFGEILNLMQRLMIITGRFLLIFGKKNWYSDTVTLTLTQSFLAQFSVGSLLVQSFLVPSCLFVLNTDCLIFI